MKNISQLIYLTIFLILFVTCIFTIAELNIIAKTDYNNHLEQSVIMSASYFILCKLIVLSVITYVSGNALYRKIQDTSMEKDLYKSMHKIMADKPWNKNNMPTEEVKDKLYSVVDSNPKELILEPIIENDAFDPIDQVDTYDKFGIDYTTHNVRLDSKGRIKDITKKVIEGNIEGRV